MMEGKLNEPDPFRTRLELAPPVNVPEPLIKPPIVSVFAPMESVPVDKDMVV